MSTTKRKNVKNVKTSKKLKTLISGPQIRIVLQVQNTHNQVKQT